jgi:HPt (histidine-containing phosphotransfer) domain-containing protein
MIPTKGSMMKSASSALGEPLSCIFANEPFIELRQMYFSGLRADQIRLIDLVGRLNRTRGVADPVFSEIRTVAHRMRGAAAIYEVPVIACAAAALEDAANSIWHHDTDRARLSVRDALETLVDCIARLAGSNTAPS